MKISYAILFGFLMILLLFAATTYINYKQSEKIDEGYELLSRSTGILKQSNRFQRNILNMVSGLRGYLLTNELFFMQSYDSAMLENDEILEELSLLISESIAQKDRLDDISALNNYWVHEFARPLIEARIHASESDSSMAAFNALYRAKLVTGLEKDVNKSLQKKFREFSDYEYTVRKNLKRSLSENIHRTKVISFGLTVFSFIAGIGIAVLIATHISSGIVKMVRMAEAISRGDYEVSMRAEGKDELGRLARSLNNMATTLSKNISLLRRKNQELDQFAYIVSHDLKAPLRGIDHVVTWIQEDHLQELPSKMTEYLGVIKGRLQRAENLLNGILSYSRVGRELQPKEEVSINALLEEVRENLPKRPGLKLHIEPDMPVLFTEKLPLQQVFTNLLVNAYRYHDKEDGMVRVYYKKTDRHYEFYIEDNGPGISKEYHKKIFVIFQTLEVRDSFESTGVGLAIVKKILDDRNLSIHLISSPGKGSTFIFTWPLETV
ncbi:MAG TPA: ATP-binding protein [Ohtaekwangia sp.]|uniref:sensor histidine kinase n=1 Tax=Ohtaekwangia sp. TaxID=2066019 RepID=UPI002F932EC4